MATEKLGFTIHRSTSDGGYHHLTLEVRPAGYSSDTLLSFTWQGDTRSDGAPGYWYAFRIQTEQHSPSAFQEAATFVRRLFPADAYEFSPAAVLEALARKKIGRVVYDGRVHQHVPVADLLPATVRSWIDDYRRLGNYSCKVGCLATTEEEAQKLITAEFAKLADEGAAVVAFVQAGRPVFSPEYDRAPEVEDLAALIAPPGAPVTEEAIAA